MYAEAVTDVLEADMPKPQLKRASILRVQEATGLKL